MRPKQKSRKALSKERLEESDRLFKEALEFGPSTFGLRVSLGLEHYDPEEWRRKKKDRG